MQSFAPTESVTKLQMPERQNPLNVRTSQSADAEYVFANVDKEQVN